MSDSNIVYQDRHSPIWVKLFAPIGLGILIVAGWQLVVNQQILPQTLLPGPKQVADRLVYDLTHTDLLSKTIVTVWEAVLGCFIASLVAIPLGYLISRWSTAEAAVSPYVAASQAVPGIAIAPLLVMWVGYGIRPIVILCSIMVFFPVLLATRLGFVTIDRELMEAGQLDGANGWQLLIHIQGPLAIPAIMTGLRNGFTMSITGAVVGEFVMGGEGLGMVIATQSANNDARGLFSTIVVLCTLAIGVYLTLMFIEKAIDPLAALRPKKNIVKKQINQVSSCQHSMGNSYSQGELSETSQFSTRQCRSRISRTSLGVFQKTN